MKTLIIIAAIIGSTLAQNLTNTGTLNGVVKDKQTNEAIPFAHIQVLQNEKVIQGTTTDFDGNFEMTLEAGLYDIHVNYVGYEQVKLKNIRINKGEVQKLDITLNNTTSTLTTMQVNYSKPVNRRRESTSGNTSHLIAYDDMPGYNFNTESYDVINENTFKDVLHNPLSTFSVDVDRASYANVRRFLNQSQKPPIDAVRIEEMINYFDFDYPQPQNGVPFSVTIEGGVCPWNESHELVMIGLKGENLNEQQIPANNLVFLIDVSGSMNAPNKLPLVKQAFKILTEQLRPQDRVSIVVYSGAVGVILESTPGNQKTKINHAIDGLTAGGYTSGGEGIVTAYRIARENYIPKGNNRVILASDGDFNVGVSSDAELVRLIEEYRDYGVFLTILGFGMGNYKDSKFEKLSNAGNGNYAYIDNILEANKIFGVELWGTLYTIAKDVKIQVEFNPAKVQAYRLVGYENRLLNKEDFNNDKKDAGDIGCGHTVTAIYEIIPAGKEASLPDVDPLKYQQTNIVRSNELMTVKIRYKNQKEETSKLIEKTVYHNQLKMTDNLLFASSVAEFGMLLRNSEFKENSSFSALIARAKQSKGKDEHGFKAEFIKLAQIAELLYK
jgi:Ca-activated chloride channel homolog